MSEKEPGLHPELEAALKAHELAVLDGTGPEIKAAYERLRQVQRRLGQAARAAAEAAKTESGEVPPQLAAS